MIFHAPTELNTFTTTPIKITARERYLLLNKLFKFGYVCVVKSNKNKLARSVVSKRCDDTFHCRKKITGISQRIDENYENKNVLETKITIEPTAIV